MVQQSKREVVDFRQLRVEVRGVTIFESRQKCRTEEKNGLSVEWGRRKSTEDERTRNQWSTWDDE